MQPIPLFSQRNLERFLTLVGIDGPQITAGAMSFCLRDHLLHLELGDDRLSMMLCTSLCLNDAQMLTLWERASPERFAGYLVRLLELKAGVALQITLPPTFLAEQLLRIYRALLSTLSPYGMLK
ncbi:hypothetical protein MUA02_01195 [Enterobacteriaceae bacterium H20N1]|uniref:Uncharacterized protein n=1 Tax=Dryocola boscaweniae TaxID=2925397 RepID=A0A9X2W3U0_9ENTR|nr:hypothetical protein [Dryocola boscaweniae]MCT4700523.1 hypothetical protein [Dryocola boscaweniae]MCT4717679.1 hypothetical protein [Dryocola boscaweniae]